MSREDDLFTEFALLFASLLEQMAADNTRLELVTGADALLMAAASFREAAAITAIFCDEGAEIGEATLN